MSLIWKPVSSFDGLYEVSSSGLVRRLAGRGRKTDRLLKPSIDHRGYMRVKLSKDCIVSMHSVHKLVCAAFIGPMPAGFTINHKDLNKQNNAADNLEYMTRLENTQHAVANGRISLSNASLSAADVQEIRRRYVPRTNSSAILAEEFGVTRRSICRIIAGTNWSHLN